MLRIKNINTYYGKVHALKNVSIHVNVGEIVALIGANGAGKTTVLNSISGITPPREGEAIFRGVNILGLPTNQIVKMGISQIPEGRQIFAPLTVSTNLELGAYHRYSRKNKPSLKKDIEDVFSFFPILRERRNQIAGTLSGGGAADAGHWQGINVKTVSASTGRAFYGAGPDDQQRYI